MYSPGYPSYPKLRSSLYFCPRLRRLSAFSPSLWSPLQLFLPLRSYWISPPGLHRTALPSPHSGCAALWLPGTQIPAFPHTSPPASFWPLVQCAGQPYIRRPRLYRSHTDPRSELPPELRLWYPIRLFPGWSHHRIC